MPSGERPAAFLPLARPTCAPYGPAPGLHHASRAVGKEQEQPVTSPRHKLGLGTVQFGLAYGVTNASGQVPRADVAAILAAALAAGVDLFDTAAAYGESETVLGELLPEKPLRLVSKIPA